MTGKRCLIDNKNQIPNIGLWNYNCVANLLHIMLKAPHFKGEKRTFCPKGNF